MSTEKEDRRVRAREEALACILRGDGSVKLGKILEDINLTLNGECL